MVKNLNNFFVELLLFLCFFLNTFAASVGNCDDILPCFNVTVSLPHFLKPNCQTALCVGPVFRDSVAHCLM